MKNRNSHKRMIEKVLLVILLFAGEIFPQDSDRFFFKLEKTFVLPEDVHGIYVTEDDEILCGANKRIYKIEKDGEITDTNSQTHIWSIKPKKNGNVLLAATDRIIEVDRDGNNKLLYKGKFDGEWGVCDLAIDNEGSILLVHGKSISLLDENFNREELLVDSTAKNFVGIGFNSARDYFLVSDVFSACVHRYFYSSRKCTYDKTFEKIYVPEYVSFNDEDEAFISLPPRNKIVSIDKNGKVYFYLIGNEYRGINTIQVKKNVSGQPLLYVSLKNEVRILSLRKKVN
jgi:hypothetical protein